MRVSKLLHNLLGKVIHLKRVKVLSEVVETVIESKELSVNRVGRRMENKAQTRSNIRKTDRLYSNKLLLAEKKTISHELAKWLIHGLKPLILVDGSKLPNSQYYTLRATLAAQGRGLTLYEEIYKQEEQGSLKLYQRFLQGLKAVLPENSVPILVTDAEFRGPWFKEILKLGWDFIGRVRGNKYCQLDEKMAIKVDTLHADATGKPEYLGNGLLNKRKIGVAGYFYRYKGAPKGRHAHTRSGRHSETEKSKRKSKSAQEPWILFSSLKKNAVKIIKGYQLRMTIEENFRDNKSFRYGLGLEMTFSKQSERYEVMLLVAMLASTIAYLIGCVGEQQNLQYQFQANSVKKRRILSRFFLGCEMLYKEVTVFYKDIIQVKQIIFDEVDLAW